MPAEHTLTYEDDGCRIATFRSILVSVWRSTPTIARLGAMARASDTLKWLSPPAGAFTVLAPNPSIKFDVADVVRARAVGNFQRYKGTELFSAFAIEGTGFMPAATRSLVAGVLLVARPTYPIRVFDARAEAASWIVPRTQNAALPNFDARALLGVVDALFAGLG